MSQAHRSKSRRRQRRGPQKTPQPTTRAAPLASATPAADAPPTPRTPPARRGGRRGAKPPARPRQRWFYDVRQYAILTDTTHQLLLLQLPADYDTGTANTWTLPGGKLEPSDEPLSGISREILEETGLTLADAIPLPVAVARWSSRNSKKLAIFYQVKVTGTAPKVTLSHEHQRAVWVKPDELKNFPFHRPEMLETVLSVLARASA